jgi:hypothetical protein
MRDLADVLERLGFPWYLTGSEALAAYGTPRQTLDTDVVIATEASRLVEVVGALGPDRHYFAEPLRAGGRWMASLIDKELGAKVDLIVRDPDAWGRKALDRRRRWQHPSWGSVWVSSLEDLVLAKLEWSEGRSELQLRDCEMLMRMNAPVIDLAYLEQWARALGLDRLLLQVSASASGHERTVDVEGLAGAS